MEPATELRDRIFAAADALYAQGARSAFSTVDAVRKMARVNMNDASTVMRAWRHAHMAHRVQDTIVVPESVQQAGSAALATVWQEAQDLAATTLRGAQSDWDAERAEADTVQRQMADACEVQSAALSAALARLRQYEDDAMAWAHDKLRLDAAMDELRDALTAATVWRERAEARAMEIERRANELRTELDHAHQEVRIAREDAAAWRGQLDALKEHHAALMQAVWSLQHTDRSGTAPRPEDNGLERR